MVITIIFILLGDIVGGGSTWVTETDNIGQMTRLHGTVQENLDSAFTERDMAIQGEGSIAKPAVWGGGGGDVLYRFRAG